jgi:hypothetical protein
MNILHQFMFLSTDTLPAEVVQYLKDSLGINAEQIANLATENSTQNSDATISDFLVLLIFLPGLIALLYLIYRFVKLIFKRQFNQIFYGLRYYPKDNERNEIHSFLAGNSLYYIQLNDVLKRKFIKRFYSFYKSKTYDFYYSEPEQKKIIFTACTEMTRITFGFSEFQLIDFTDFNFYPQEYALKGYSQKAYGHTSDSGYIDFSTPKMEAGIAITNDGDNLLLHELAHAIYIQKTAIDFDTRYNKIYDVWESFAKYVMGKVSEGEISILRNYAFTNTHEMLAVSTEYFFEKPLELKYEQPEMFYFMKYLYNQNTLDKLSPVLNGKESFKEIWSDFKLENLNYSNEASIVKLENIRRRENRGWIIKIMGILVMFLAPPIFYFLHIQNYFLYFLILIYLSVLVFMVGEKYQIFKQISATRPSYDLLIEVIAENFMSIIVSLIYILFFFFKAKTILKTPF